MGFASFLELSAIYPPFRKMKIILDGLSKIGKLTRTAGFAKVEDQ
jgi:hypothetical protein